MDVLKYAIVMAIMAAGFALFCLALRLFLVKNGTPETGQVESVEEEDERFNSELLMHPDDVRNMGPTSSRWHPQ